MSKGGGSHIKWDEEVIAEHDKERGTRQKIDEPPTPYHYEDKLELLGEDQGERLHHAAPPDARTHSIESNWEALNAKLAYEHMQQQRDSSDLEARSQPMEVVEDEPVSEDKKRHNAFVAKRESHYNEFKVLQALREKHALDDEDDDCER